MARLHGPTCQECKVRKISCSKDWPTCANCTLRGRICRRNRFPLSWPKTHDKRRHVVGPNPGHSPDGVFEQKELYRHFVHISLHEVAASESHGLEFWNKAVLKQQAPNEPLLKPSPELSRPWGDAELLRYFYCVSFHGVPRLDRHRDPVRNVMLRLALHDDSFSSQAVKHAILFLSAVHRYGDVSNAGNHKQMALRALRESSRVDALDHVLAQQHIAANLILCRAEMALHAREGSDWSIHIAGAKMIVTSLSQAKLELLTSTAEGATLYQSLEYHDVLARFGLQHWRRHELEGETFDSVRNPLEKIAFEPLSDSDCVLVELKVLDRVLALARKLKQINIQAHEAIAELIKLNNEIEQMYAESIARIGRDPYPPEEGLHDESTSTEESYRTNIDNSRSILFQIATQIFFERALFFLSGTSKRMTNVLDEAYRLVRFNLRVKDCRTLRRVPPFALLLIGTEARNDDERMAILDLIEQTNTEAEDWLQADGLTLPKLGFRSTALNCVSDVVKKLWIKQDLNEPEQEYCEDYGTRLCEVLSSCAALPCLL